MKDMHSDLSVASAIDAATLAADNTPAAIDLRGFDAAEIVLAIGAGGITFTSSNKIEFKLTHSEEDASYEPVTEVDVLGVEEIGSGGVIKALVAAHAQAGVYRFGYVGGKRYLKLLAAFSGTHGTGTPIAGVVIRGHGQINPQTAQA
ncbi:hypothetical protein K1T73_07055 [Roseovarius sp. SCSIO 43702]|uniref:hypothetical protein n=1 Tax=Roseovarius sp. SCSIO 43702 TaxID=2823043 RepID=UPI001C73B0C5|nr:hypothetical protein [Roseovarius sp. SCSIO 43702]QYX58117.1 hypothetical protein K1T73_07055 [Roseovarius sp. SCSIO 43702]